MGVNTNLIPCKTSHESIAESNGPVQHSSGALSSTSNRLPSTVHSRSSVLRSIGTRWHQVQPDCESQKCLPTQAEEPASGFESSTLPKAWSRTAETTSGRRNFALYWRHYIRYSNLNGFGHTVFFYQLFIGLSAVCSAFRLLFSSPKLVYKVNNNFVYLLIVLL